MKDTTMARGREARHGDGQHRASVRLRIGPVRLRSEAAISTRGLLATGALVSGILLSTAVLVMVATRKLPDGALPHGLRRT
ncbi:hypothetical protein [Coralloluteibacterium thermophilus]|uniref:Uncharacterized protein n=1 Tax=Coralloluteibacterium thermophilum TaxID=2707049 RepID=A0ABV9NJN5_9GAMM